MCSCASQRNDAAYVRFSHKWNDWSVEIPFSETIL
jgi:hypothetical protein